MCCLRVDKCFLRRYSGDCSDFICLCAFGMSFNVVFSIKIACILEQFGTNCQRDFHTGQFRAFSAKSIPHIPYIYITHSYPHFRSTYYFIFCWISRFSFCWISRFVKVTAKACGHREHPGLQALPAAFFRSYMLHASWIALPAALFRIWSYMLRALFRIWSYMLRASWHTLFFNYKKQVYRRLGLDSPGV